VSNQIGAFLTRRSGGMPKNRTGPLLTRHTFTADNPYRPDSQLR
jgi:hypothetical protein